MHLSGGRFVVPREHYWEIMAEIPNFSSKITHKPSEISPVMFYFSGDDPFEILTPDIYANGIDANSEGYVSVILNNNAKLFTRESFKLTGSVAVVDISDNRRFLQSFSASKEQSVNFDLDGLNRFPFDKYLSRSNLLDDPCHFHSDDCLLLEIKMVTVTYLHIFASLNRCPDIDLAFTENSSNKETFKLKLDTKVGKLLCQSSQYFNAMIHTPMLERSRMYVELPYEELPTLKHISIALLGIETLDIESLEDIRGMYILSDKYGITTIFGLCRLLIESFLRIAVSDSEELCKAINMKKELKSLEKKWVDLDNKEEDAKASNQMKTAIVWTCRRTSSDYTFYKENKTSEPEFMFYQ